MGKYNDIWTRVKEYDKAEKERKRKQRAEKRKQLEEKRNQTIIPLVEDVSLNDESIAGEDEDTLPVWATTDYRVVKNYVPPVFNPGVPNLKKNGALKNDGLDVIVDKGFKEKGCGYACNCAEDDAQHNDYKVDLIFSEI